MEKDFEKSLNSHLQKAIDDYVQGEKDNVSYLDCLWGRGIWLNQFRFVEWLSYGRTGRLSGGRNICMLKNKSLRWI